MYMRVEQFFDKYDAVKYRLYLFKRPFRWAYFRGSLLSEGFVIGRNFAFQNGFVLSIKTVGKQPKTAKNS